MIDCRLEQMRTRWRRWLGNKTAAGKPYWTTLLGGRWSSWCRRVSRKHNLPDDLPWDRDGIKDRYRKAIDAATFEELLDLDNVYASELSGI